MDFIIHLPVKGFESVFAAPPANEPAPAFLRFEAGKAALKLQRFHHGQEYIYLIGDCILPYSASAASTAALLAGVRDRGAIHELKGFFYLLFLNFGEKRLEVHSSFLNILPVYYRQTDESLTVSSSLRLVATHEGRQPKASEEYVVEKLLFHYAFLNHTPFEGVDLLPSCHYLRLDGAGLSFPRPVELSDYYLAKPQPWRGRLDELSDLFISETSPFIPWEPFALTLTGGFDGRTILSLAQHQGARFSTFSYGLATDPDVIVPTGVGKQLGFEHLHFDLGNGYAKDHFWEDGLTFINQTEGAGNLSRAHYVHTARSLGGDFPFLLSGNFGSEILRSMKDPGVMASPILFALFASKDKAEFRQQVLESPALRYIDQEQYAQAIEAVAEAAWNYREELPQGLTVNQQFYLYMFEEVFRKYFGPEIVMQTHYLCHRAPFLSFSLFKTLLGSTLAGANNDFRETNPLRRFHGQILYAHILQKTSPALLDILLDRGYRPRDFLTLLGPLNIAWGYFRPNGLHRQLKKLPAYNADYYRANSEKITAMQKQMRVLQPDWVRQEVARGGWDAGEQELVNALSMELYYAENL
ncbi:MAG: hypothetical protein IPG32_05325 [Saprospirales bacterium]|nr:hypothetical protein [Saprospirales bacterium]